MNFKVSNFSQQNTPDTAQAVGNYLLLAGMIGTAIVTMPATVIVFPAVFISLGSWLAALGVIGKVVSKFFGEDAGSISTSQDTQEPLKKV